MHNVIFLKKNAAMITYINNDIKKEMKISMAISVLLFFCIKIPAKNDNVTIFNVNDTLDFILTNSIFFFSSLNVFFSFLFIMLHPVFYKMPDFISQALFFKSSQFRFLFFNYTPSSEWFHRVFLFFFIKCIGN